MSKYSADDYGKQYWEKVADREFLSMDAEARAQWAELRPNGNRHQNINR